MTPFPSYVLPRHTMCASLTLVIWLCLTVGIGGWVSSSGRLPALEDTSGEQSLALNSLDGIAQGLGIRSVQQYCPAGYPGEPLDCMGF